MRKIIVSPPSVMQIDDFSINAIKTIYTISKDNPKFKNAIINFNPLFFVNNALSFSLREILYRNYNSTKRGIASLIWN